MSFALKAWITMFVITYKECTIWHLSGRAGGGGGGWFWKRKFMHTTTSEKKQSHTSVSRRKHLTRMKLSCIHTYEHKKLLLHEKVEKNGYTNHPPFPLSQKWNSPPLNTIRKLVSQKWESRGNCRIKRTGVLVGNLQKSRFVVHGLNYEVPIVTQHNFTCHIFCQLDTLNGTARAPAVGLFTITV